MSNLSVNASLGLQSVAETGDRTQIHAELEEQKKLGAVHQAKGTTSSEKIVVNMDGTPTTVDIRVDEKHPYLEVVTMVAPSPDWYAFASVNLFQGDAFIKSKEVFAFGYDAGTDEGQTYTADNAATSPRGTISSLSNVQPFNQTEVKLLKLRLVRKDEEKDDSLVSSSPASCYPSLFLDVASIFQFVLILCVARSM